MLQDASAKREKCASTAIDGSKTPVIYCGKKVGGFDAAEKQDDKPALTAEYAASIPCGQILGASILRFIRRR